MAAVVTTAPQENPLTAGLERLPVAPTTLVIFGATGDLARRKLLPALYNLAHDGALPEHFNLVGVARKEKEHEDYRQECEQAIRQFSRRTPDPGVLPFDRAVLLPRDRGGAWCAGPGSPRGGGREGDHREAVWHLARGGT